MTTTVRAKKKRKATARAHPRPRRPARPAGGTGPAWREDFGLTRKALARMTGLSERTLASWEAGAKLSDSAARALIAIERLLRASAEVVHKEVIAAWLEKPNDAFDGLKPAEILERGEADRIWRMVYFLGSGAAS